MATYNMTPQERRARAQALIQYRENRSLYNKYRREKEEADRLLREQQLDDERQAEILRDQNFLVKGLSTIGDVVGNVLTGAVKGLEGIVDLGIGLVGAVGGIFSDDFQDTMRQAVSYDFAGEIVGNPLQEAMKYSYLENGGIVEQISSGIGQMLPAVIATIATYGAYGGFAAGASAAQVAAAQAAAQTASLVTLGVSAAGTSTEEAFNEGANYYAGLGYGVASGLVEVGTEKLFGGATKALTGAGVFDGITKSVAQTGWKRVALNAAEEGVEEVVAELARPALKTIYKGTDALSDYGKGEYWKGVGEAGLVGGLTALAYSGSIGYGMSKAGFGYVGKEADISESLTEIGSLREKAINLQAEDNLDETNERKIAETTKKNYLNIEKVLKSVTEPRRKGLIEKFSLQKAFNPDGSMSAEISALFDEGVQEARVSGDGENGENTPLASPKKNSYSFSLRGNEATIQSDLDRLSENRAQAYLEEHQALGENITIEQAREAVGKFSVLTSEMSDKAKAARRKFNKALNALNRISGLNTSFIITEANETFDGSLVDNERMYISADAFENDTWAETIVHEVTHLEEGSEEYAKMVDFLQSDDILVDVQTESGEVKRIPLWQKAQSAVLGKDYGFDENKIKVISEKVNAQMGLTPEEVKLYREFMTEVAAHETQYLLGTEAFIDKIVASDRSLARKLVDKILNLKEAFSKVGDKATRGQLKMLRQAEKLYLDAARKAGDMRLVKYILSRSPETEEEVDSDAQIVYNRKKTARYIPYEKVGDEVIRHIKTELKKIYNNEDGVADGIAIEHGSDVYIVDSGRENGSTTFGIRRRRRISDAKLRAEFIRSTNNDAISKRFVSDEISSRVGNGLGGDSGRNMRRESRTELQTDSRESQDNQVGVLGENADNGRVSDSDIRFNLHHDEAFYETEHGKLIASAMDMATCKQMIERIYRIVNPNQYEDTPIYKNAEHWLELVGASEVAMYVDNEYLIQEKYLNNIPALIDGDIYSEDIIEAYQDGALNGGNNKKQAVRLNISENIEGEDSRFFAPQKVDEAKKLYEVAKQKVTNANRQEVMQARARILIFAHNKGAVEALGITQTELNKNLRSWANYSSKAREMSQRFNSGVAFSNMWTGIENSSYLYNSSVSEEDFASLVGNIEGRSTEYERRYIANTMLALDTHIDYTGINFIFGANFEKGSVRGTYSDGDRTVRVRGGAGQNTVSHEIGHAIDHQWQRDVWRFVGRDSSSRTNNGLSEGRTNFDLITDEEVKQWVKNFFVFVDNISDSGSISSEYTQSKNEVFARFVAQFVEWTSQIATGRNQSFGYSGFNDKFTAAQFIEFVKILQEKAKLDMRFRAFEDNTAGRFDNGDESVRFSLRTKEPPQKTIKAYKVFFVKNGGLYPPMVANPNGEPTPIGVWLDADIGQSAGTSKTGRPQVKAGGKGTQGGSGTLAFRPGWHLGEYPKATQFNRLNPETGKKELFPRDFVWAECEIAADVNYQEEAMSYGYTPDGKFRHAYAGLPRLPVDGYYQYRTNPDPSTVPWFITGAMKVTRILDDNDVREILADFGIDPIEREGGDIDLSKYGLERGEIKFSLKKDRASLDYIEEKYKPYAKYLFVSENGNQIKLHNIVLKESSRGQGIGQAFLDDLIEYADREGKIITLTPTREYGTYERLKKWYKRNGFVENKGRRTDFRLSDTMYRLPATSDSNIRFNLVDDPTAKPYFYELTDGQVKKLLANSTKMKVYSKVESEGIINDILGNYMSFGDVYGVLSGKSKAEVIDMLWRGLNTAEPGRRAKVALDVAEYIIQHSVVESMYDDASTEVYMDTIALLKPYLHKINLNGIKGEIKHRYDRDNSPYLLWGKRKGDSGLGADVIAMELDELGFHIDAINEADIFFQIDEAYRSAVAGLKKEAKSMLDSALNAEERKQLKQEIARQVLIAFDEKGKPSKLSAFLEEYAKKAKVWREKYYEERSKNKLLNRVLDKIQKLKDIKLGTFLNASQFKNDVFKGSIERLASIKYRGNLNESGTRGILDGLAEWYVKENPMLQGVFDEDIASALLTLARGEGKLTVDELKALENVIDYFKHFVETYNKVWRGGQYVEAQPIAEKYVSIVRRNKPAKVGWLRKFFEKYETSFADPMTLVRYMDRYDEGFYTEILAELRKGAVGASVMEMEMREPLEAFYKKHKKFLKEMSTKTIEYQGTQIPLAQAMLLYMSLNRDQAILGLAKSGFTFNDGKETIRLAGFALEEDLEIEEIRVRAKEVQSALASQFTEVEKEYISIAEKLFNETCKEAKKKTDILRRGYTNALEDYYVPIRRANIAHNVDTSTFFDEMSRVSNASFNRDTVKGAKNELFIEPLDAVLDRHIRAVAQYANLALAIDQYNLLYNLDIGDNPNKPTSVKTESVDMWSEGDAYFKKLISDIQGIPASKGDGVRFMGWLRGSYAKYQLGANPKVWITQLSSFAAAGNILDIDCIIKGIGVKASDVDEYCGLAKVRNTENAAALAQGVVEKTGKVGDVLMKPIGMVDRFVIARLFGACQLQIEKNEGLKVGTKENKVKAGELLEKVILETQQNALATEKSSAMRSGSELMKTLTMFSADSMKVIGRVVDAIGEVSVLKAKRKLATDPDEIASLDKKIKAANKKARRAVGSLVSSAVFMALVAQLFRWLYNKDDEDDNVAVNMTVDAIGNLLGGLPLIRDIYSRFAEGYDFDNYAYSAINDMFDSAEMLFTTAGNIFEGDMDSREVALTIKNLLYAGGQMFGIPTRNVYNIIYGLTKRISPSTAYSIDDMFYKQNYRSDLAKAIEQEDEAMVATITSLMLDENIGGIADSEARKELDSLVQKGFDVIPRSVSKKITYDGVEYELTPNQVKQFEKVYFVANEALASLVKMSQYKGATDEVKAKAVNFIYNVYYNLALQDFLGVDLETKSVLFAEAIDIEKLAIIVATANSLKADLDKKGVAISGTRKVKIQSYVNSLQLKAVEKYMIMGYLGYKNTKGEIQVKAYINRLSLTKTEKAKLLEYSGYAS